MLVAFLVGVTALIQIQRDLERSRLVNSFINAPEILGSGGAAQINTLLEDRFGLASGFQYRVLDLRVSSNTLDPTIIAQAGNCVALDPELKAIGMQNWAGVGVNYVRAIGVCLGGGQNELSIQTMPIPTGMLEAIGIPTCFTGDTDVLALDDRGNSIKVPISKLAPGMHVLSLPEVDLEELIGPRGSNVDEIGVFSKLVRHLAPKKITKVHIHERSQSGMIKLQVTGGIINTTPEHPFFVLGIGWIPAGSLKPKDNFFSLGYSMVEVLGISSLPNSGKLYNITVEDFHTYFVFANGQDDPVLVHNEKGTVPDA